MKLSFTTPCRLLPAHLNLEPDRRQAWNVWNVWNGLHVSTLNQRKPLNLELAPLSKKSPPMFHSDIFRVDWMVH
jgi:hypothetical protein